MLQAACMFGTQQLVAPSSQVRCDAYLNKIVLFVNISQLETHFDAQLSTLYSFANLMHRCDVYW